MKGSDVLEIRIWGKHVVEEALRSSIATVHEIWTAEKQELEIRNRNVRVHHVSKDALYQKLGTEKNQSIGARISLRVWDSVDHWWSESKKPDSSIVVALDSLEDPQNVGGIYRSAHFFGVGAILMTKDRSSSLTGTVAKASTGALFSVPTIRATNLARELEELAEIGYWRMGLAAEAKETLSSRSKSAKSALVLGSEGDGLRRLTAEKCDELIKLTPEAKRDSLNVSVAAAIALYELYRPAK